MTMMIAAAVLIGQCMKTMVTIGHRWCTISWRWWIAWSRWPSCWRISIHIAWWGSYTVGPERAATGYVLSIAGRHLLTLIACQLYCLSQFLSDWTPVTTLTKQWIYSLYLVPALFSRNFWQVSGRFAMTLLIQKFYSYSMSTNLPVEVVTAILKPRQKWNRTVEAREFSLWYRTEATISCSTGNSIFC